MSHSKGIRNLHGKREARVTEKTVIIKMSPREKRELDYEADVCGMLKIDYCRNRALREEIIVQRSPRVFWGMKKHCLQAAAELEQNSAEEITGELLQKVKFLVKVFEGLKED